MSDDDDWVGTPPEGRHSRDRATAWASTKAALRAVFLSMGIELLAALAIAVTWVVGVLLSRS